MSVQLARYLKDFGTPLRPKSPAFQPPSIHHDEEVNAAPEPFAAPLALPPVDVEAERAAALEEGRLEAEAELRVKYEAEIAALQDAHKAELEAQRIRYEQDYASALAERFAILKGDVADVVAAQAAQVLAPVMNQVLTKGAVADLARMISEGLQEGEGVTLTIKGPTELFEQLKARFDDPAPVFRHVETQDVDLTVEFGETVLVTRMAAWADTVRKVLA